MKRAMFFLLILAFASLAHAEMPPQSNILIFVSFSMPKESIKIWMREAKKIHAPLIIRGLINNSFNDTTKTIYELVKDEPGGVQIDPILFERFQIKKVPAVVVTESPHCLPNQSCLDSHDVIYGDVTLEYALKKMARERDDLSPIAENALQLLKEKSNA